MGSGDSVSEKFAAMHGRHNWMAIAIVMARCSPSGTALPTHQQEPRSDRGGGPRPRCSGSSGDTRAAGVEQQKPEGNERLRYVVPAGRRVPGGLEHGTVDWVDCGCLGTIRSRAIKLPARPLAAPAAAGNSQQTRCLSSTFDILVRHRLP